MNKNKEGTLRNGVYFKLRREMEKGGMGVEDKALGETWQTFHQMKIRMEQMKVLRGG